MPTKKKQPESVSSGSPQNSPKEKKTHSRKRTPVKKPSRATKAKKKPLGFPIVGIGASAGGLEVLEKFFEKVAEDPGMAFVLVTHLDPNHASVMPELIQKHTGLKVAQVKDGMRIEKNCVYVIPPDRDMGIMNGTLLLTKAKIGSEPRAPINSFLRSLAEDQGDKAIAVILSGMGMDGTESLKAIKGNLGMVMAQDPATCKYDSMPKNAIATGLVDYILAPEKMAERLEAYVNRSVLRQLPTTRSYEEIPAKALQKIYMLLRSTTGHDFSAYKESTTVRRLQRRMDVHQIENVSDYLVYLNQSAKEVKALFKDLLIGVTGFFRDADAFEALKKKALNHLLQEVRHNHNLRVWIPGCATGEESYTLAMVIQECMDELERELSVQIFATDIDDDAIGRARAGFYPGDISDDVTPERLEKFFVSMENGYQVNRKTREMLVFAAQSIIKDPPFTRLDLICCRNLLIYLQRDPQKMLMPLFHYCLKPGGVLFLGSSESVGEFTDLFVAIDTKWKIYKRKETARGVYPVMNYNSGPKAHPEHLPEVRPSEAPQLSQILQRHLMQHHTPATVVIDENGEVAYIHGRTGNYLEPASGLTRTNNINEMAREGLRTRLPSMIRTVVREKTEIQNKLRVRRNGDFLTVNVIVEPLSEPEVGEFYMVLFEEFPFEEEKEKEKTLLSGERDPGKCQDLEEELRYARESLQTTIEELEASNEELRSLNEEYQSANEELQSANEELNSSKEELQSLNEELETVNAELQGKNVELTQINDDMKNLLDSVEIPTIFLDNQLRISRFTSGIQKIFNLRNSDVGRPLSDMVTHLKYKNLIEDAKQVLVSLVPRELEASTEHGRWYAVKMRPYRSADNVIEGLILIFVDIHAQRMAIQRADEMIDTVREPLIVLDENLRVERANTSFYRTFKTLPKETEGRWVYDLGNGQWNMPELRKLLDEIIPENSFFDGFEIEYEFPEIGRKKLLVNARKIERAAETPESILLAIEDASG